mgnify:CR=1 FL=1
MAHPTAWRHTKIRGGYLLDYGVHNSDLLLYFMGEVDSVYAETRLWEKVRSINRKPLSEPMSKFYSHRVRETLADAETIDTDSEDMILGLVRFRSGAIGQFGMSMAAPGQGTSVNILYCDDGSIQSPQSRSGAPVAVTLAGESAEIPGEDVLGLVPDWKLDNLTASFWNRKNRITAISGDWHSRNF